MTLDQTASRPALPLPSRYVPWLYIAAAYAIAWTGVWLIVGPYGFPGRSDDLASIYPLAFAAMAAGPLLAALLVTAATGGWSGLQELLGRLVHWRVKPRYYLLALLLVPTTLAAVLFAAALVSPAFTPGIFAGGDVASLLMLGIALGLAAGWFEEIGWTGVAIHRLLPQLGLWRTGLVMGVIHGLWHLLIGYWGEGANFGLLYLPYFLLLWIVGLVALRVLITWLYARTGSVLVAQLAHASYTGSLMILWPVTTAPMEIVIWTGAFACCLLLVVTALCRMARP